MISLFVVWICFVVGISAQPNYDPQSQQQLKQQTIQQQNVSNIHIQIQNKTWSENSFGFFDICLAFVIYSIFITNQ
jgi:hypothetical protein